MIYIYIINPLVSNDIRISNYQLLYLKAVNKPDTAENSKPLCAG